MAARLCRRAACCLALLLAACGGAPAPTGSAPTIAAPTATTLGRGTVAASSPPSPAAISPASASPSRASASPSRAGATPAGATPAAASRQPLGATPSGWKTYPGHPRVPAAFHYPPTWTVDESQASEGRLYLLPPGTARPPLALNTWLLIATTGTPDPNANIDVLRDQYYRTAIQQEHPEAGLSGTSIFKLSGLTFVRASVVFVVSGLNYQASFGYGLKAQVPWMYRLHGPLAGNDRTAHFGAILDSLNIYANP